MIFSEGGAAALSGAAAVASISSPVRCGKLMDAVDVQRKNICMVLLSLRVIWGGCLLFTYILFAFLFTIWFLIFSVSASYRAFTELR